MVGSVSGVHGRSRAELESACDGLVGGVRVVPQTVRRGKHEIRADILRVARVGAIKTHLVYGANLNFVILKPHLQALIDGGMIEEHRGKYYTTEHGLKYIGHVAYLQSCEGMS